MFRVHTRFLAMIRTLMLVYMKCEYDVDSTIFLVMLANPSEDPSPRSDSQACNTLDRCRPVQGIQATTSLERAELAYT